mgnify:FL=1
MIKIGIYLISRKITLFLLPFLTTKTNMKKLLLVTFSMLLAFTGWSQKTITGVVNDSSGVPLPGAAVVIDGSNDGVATDFDGKYSIEANVGDVLVFSLSLIHI